jgi:hypothetical protein
MLIALTNSAAEIHGRDQETILASQFWLQNSEITAA